MPSIVKNTTFPGLLDLIVPHSCRGCGLTGNVLCDRCKNYIISSQTNFCPHCKSPTPAGKCSKCPNLPPIYIGGERTGLLDVLIRDFKYHSVRALAAPLAEILDHALPEFTNPVTIVPLPTAQQHIRSRALDHTYLIAKRLSRLPNRHYHLSKLLTRTNDTVQVGADHATRIKQASAAYAISPRASVDPSITYLLLDDVWTTGASMQAAIKKLRQAGAEHLAVAILAVSRLD